MRTLLPIALCVSLAGACGGDASPTAPPPTPPPSPPPVSTISLSGVPDELEVGATVTPVVTLRDAAGNTLTGRPVRWASDSDGVATVTAAGVVTAAGPGNAIITATSEGRSASFPVKVDTRTGFLAAIVESVRAAHDLPALTGAITTRDGGLFGAAASGRRRISSEAPVTNADMWHIGSNLKAITGYVAAMAVDDGVITWATTLGQAYPELAGSMQPEYRDVTLRQLLSHVGGIIPNIANAAVAGSGSLTTQRTNIAAWATGLPPAVPVGTFNYSNVTYMIAANMVERALGSSWEHVMQSRLLAPLGITAFGWGPAPAAQNPIGHRRSGTSWTEHPTTDNPPYLSAAGRSHWSMEAWARVLQDIMKADRGQSALVTEANARITTTAQANSYSVGWQVTTAAWSGGGRGVQHDGSNTVNYARAQVALDRGVAVMAVTNSHDTDSARSSSAMAQLTTLLWAYYAKHGQ